jgi:hypothetical protein
MPVKKTKATSSAKIKKSPALPEISTPKKPRFLPPRPLQVETETAVVTTPAIALGVGMICATLIGVAFFANLMAAVTSTRIVKIESNESISNYELQNINNYDEFVAKYGDIKNTRYFNVYVKSTAMIGRNSFTDKCLKDVCDNSGKCVATAVDSCSLPDGHCRLQEGFVISPGLKLGNWSYGCKYGCKNGACVRPPVCTDSDLNSATGQSDPFMKGFTKGMGADGKIVNMTDFCTQGNVWPSSSSTPTGPFVAEWYCDKGIVSQVLVGCDSGCVDGACSNGLMIISSGSGNMPSQYVLGNKSYSNALSYNFMTQKTGIIVDEVSFEVFGTSVEAGDQPVKSLAFNGKTGTVVNNRVKFSNLNLSIPKGYSGKDFAIGITVNKVGGVGGIKVGNNFAVIIQNVKWHDSAGRYNSKATSGSNNLFPVAGLPVMSLKPQASGGLRLGTVKLADLTLTANGTVLIKKIPFKILKSSTVVFDQTKFVLKNSTGTVVATGSNITDSLVDFTINGGYAVSGDRSFVLSLYAQVIDIGNGNAGTAYVSTGLGYDNRDEFVWDDVSSNFQNLNGMLIYSYPTDTTTITN